jgi:heme oxygenase
VTDLAEVHADSTIMTELKERTRQLHQETEAAVDLMGRLRSKESYADLLSRFYGLYAPLEQKLGAIIGWESIGIDLSERIKSPLILKDLEVLGWSSSRLAQIPVCQSLPNITNLSEGLGCMYVLEGSTLGAQHIQRAVERQLGLAADHGCSFFNGYGSEQTGAMWRDFGASAVAYHEAHPASGDVIISAACDTFALIKEWIACRAI